MGWQDRLASGPVVWRWGAIAFLSSVLLLGACQTLPAGSDSVRAPLANPTELVVSAAASLTPVAEVIAQLYAAAEPTVRLTFNIGSSGSLQRQIEQGAPVDVFIAAAPRQMDALEVAGLLTVETRRDLLSNAIVLIVPQAGPMLEGFEDLTRDRVQRLAMGAPESVPAGQYAQEVLTNLGLFQALRSKLVLAKDVQQVVTYVATANVDAGFVYATDAKGSQQVAVVATAPATTHSPIRYPIAAIASSRHPQAAKAFIEFLGSDRAQETFADFGFVPLALTEPQTTREIP